MEFLCMTNITGHLYKCSVTDFVREKEMIVKAFSDMLHSSYFVGNHLVVNMYLHD
jgi:hypothetical protein